MSTPSVDPISKINSDLAAINAKINNNSQGKLQYRIDVTTALGGLERISHELTKVPVSDETALVQQKFSKLQQEVQQIAQQLGITPNKASFNSSLSGSSYASFFGKKSQASSQSSSLSSLKQLQERFGKAPITSNNPSS